ncbi:uncharacterized protein LOC110118166 isoform X2 [Ceratitis capitata]|uniref:uncharacterized protein LOC110118166 isoform X2 n=1 Tax=Ceratitis capitata TaxID=7213 RepID=UPI000A100889|nr:uncharacterized protein LOC110118166 isoform X2 [Ceratitis capitata]
MLEQDPFLEKLEIAERLSSAQQTISDHIRKIEWLIYFGENFLQCLLWKPLCLVYAIVSKPFLDLIQLVSFVINICNYVHLWECKKTCVFMFGEREGYKDLVFEIVSTKQHKPE